MKAEDAPTTIRVGYTQKDERDTKEDLRGKKRDKKDNLSSHDNVKPRNDRTKRTANFTPW